MPGRRQPQRKLPAQLGHARPVFLSRAGNIFCAGDEYPDDQLARIVAGPQFGPQHRAVREQCFHLMIKDPLDLRHVPSTAHEHRKVSGPGYR